MGEHQRVAVDVDDPGVGGVPLGDLMGVVGGGQPGADVEELAYPLLDGEVPHGAAQELAAGARHVDQAGEDLLDLVPGLPVDLVVVLPAHEVVPEPGGVRRARVDPRADVVGGDERGVVLRQGGLLGTSGSSVWYEPSPRGSARNARERSTSLHGRGHDGTRRARRAHL